MTLNRIVRTALTLALAATLSGVGSLAAQAQSNSGPDQPKSEQSGPALPANPPTDQLIIKYKSGVEHTGLSAAASDQMQTLSAVAGVPLTYFREMSGGAHVLKLSNRIPEAEVQAIAERLMALPEIAYAEPDRIKLPLGTTPNDPQYSAQWHYFAPAVSQYGANLPDAWDITIGNPNIRVAVLDTGILANHPDLIGRTVAGYDMIFDPFVANDGGGRDADPSDPGDWELANECGPGSSPSDSSWHGTHVAGTIGAASHNNIGVAGINWLSPIQAVRVLGKCGGYDSDIADGIRWAAGLSVSGVPNNATPSKVLNLSLGGSGPCDVTTQNAVNAAVGAGAVVVVAAGNSNSDAGNYSPSSCANVITVAASNRNGDKASYSNFGASVEIAAPGGETSFANSGVLSTLNAGRTSPAANGYAWYQGTSMATPHVAGVASLIFSLAPSLTPAQVGQILTSTVTAFPGGSTCPISGCGSGILNAYGGVSILPRITTFSPTAITTTSDISLTVNGANFANNAVVQWNGSNRPTTFINRTELRAAISSAELTTPGAVSITVSGSYVPYGSITTAAKALNVSLSQAVYLPLVNRNSAAFVTSAVANGNFESGRFVSWSEGSAQGYEIVVSTGGVTPHGGSWKAWLGGDDNEVAFIQQQVTVPANTPYLIFYHFVSSQDAPGYDFGRVKINGNTVQTIDLAKDTSGWVLYSVNLSAYAGQSVTLRFEATTDVSAVSSWFIDDVGFSSLP
jgi:serine protease